jgi:hypothetical protein
MNESLRSLMRAARLRDPQFETADIRRRYQPADGFPDAQMLRALGIG